MEIEPQVRARLLSLFVAEAEEGFALLEELCGRFTVAGADQEALVQFGRTAHGLKGAAAAVGLEEVATRIHSLEEHALSLREVPLSDRDARQQELLQAVRLLQLAISGIDSTGLGPSAREALQSLKRLQEPSAPAAEAAAEAGAPDAHAPVATGPDLRVDRLSVESAAVDEALRLASAVVRAATEITERPGVGDVADATAVELSILAARLEQLLVNLRLVPVEEALSGLDREISQLAERLGKQVRYQLLGEGVRADRRTLQLARGLLRHLFRNAVDHGIEPPEVRARLGKPPAGELTLQVATSESQLWLDLRDDGAGFNLPAIRERLGADPGVRELLSALSDEEVLMEFATRGGSTRGTATEISGRGLGLSSVVEQVRQRGGELRVRSQMGQGAQVSLRLPLDVFATELLTVHVGGQVFGVPIASVERTLLLSAESEAGRLRATPSGTLLALDERIIAYRTLASTVELPSEEASCRFAVVLRDEKREVAFGVEELGVAVRVIPRNAPPVVHPDALVTGVAVLPDRRHVQVLNPALLLAAALRERASAPRVRREPTRALRVLLAEDSLATREVLRVLLEREGYRVRVAGDGLEAQARIAEELPDVVVTDLNMPRCDGLALTKALRGRPHTSALPIVILTSQDDAPTRLASEEAGATAYLVKSKFSSELLRETLRRVGEQEA